jgi:hypothetical protein
VSDIKYPYIGRITKSGSIILFYGKGTGVTLDSKTCVTTDGEHNDNIDERYFKNITREYLANTYGKVESKEHAEFIVELAENAGFTVSRIVAIDSVNSFMFYDASNCSLHRVNQDELSNEEGRKQITIPMPPKCDEPLNNGDNLLFGGDDKCKEWPCVGDEVLAPFDRVNVKATVCWQRVNDSGIHVSLLFDDDYEAFWCVTGDLQKPKTLEEELCEDIEYAIHHFEGDKVAGRKWLMNKYNITKKPQ